MSFLILFLGVVCFYLAVVSVMLYNDCREVEEELEQQYEENQQLEIEAAEWRARFYTVLPRS